MISHHGKRLKNAREHAPDYRTFILRTYTYLRDSTRGNFYHESMVEGLWKYPMSSPGEGVQSRSLPADDTTPASGCGHCRNKFLHQRLSMAYGRDHCPLKELARAKAKAAASAIMKVIKEDSSADLKKVVKEQLDLAR
jgi:hypothetical protein